MGHLAGEKSENMCGTELSFALSFGPWSLLSLGSSLSQLFLGTECCCTLVYLNLSFSCSRRHVCFLSFVLSDEAF